MFFLIEDNDLLEKCNTIWDKVLIFKKNLIANLFTIIFFEIKILSYGNEATDVHDKDICKTGFDYNCLAVMLSVNVFKRMKIHWTREKTWLDILLKKEKFFLMILTKNNFLLQNKRLKKLHEKFAPCKLLLFYLYTLNHGKFLLITLSTSYTVYQSLFIWLTKIFCF